MYIGLGSILGNAVGVDDMLQPCRCIEDNHAWLITLASSRQNAQLACKSSSIESRKSRLKIIFACPRMTTTSIPP